LAFTGDGDPSPKVVSVMSPGTPQQALLSDGLAPRNFAKGGFEKQMFDIQSAHLPKQSLTQ
jgi:hypothetical protein